MEITYKPQLAWSGTITFCCLFIFVLGLPSLLSNPMYMSGVENITVSISSTLILLFLPLYALFGLYVRVTDDEVCRTDYFVWKKCLRISDIDAILYRPTWGVGQTARRLQIINSKGFYQELQLTNTAFRQSDIAALVSLLRKNNPSIQLDEDAEALVKRHAAL
jgi:hypothetical protein